MQDMYLLGVLLAICAGIANNCGLLLQKKVVNSLPEGEKVGRNLLKKPLWILGFSLEMAVGTVFFLLANSPQYGVGAALVPGLMAAGLIVLAIGSIKLLKERVTLQDIIGIGLMIGGIALLGFSKLEIKMDDPSILTTDFLIRTVIFTAILIVVPICCQIFQARKEKYRGILLAIFSGSMFGISNFWVAPLIAVFGFVFSTGQFILLFIITVIILLAANVFGVFKIQQAFQHGDASKLIPIQQVPIQIAPIFVYFAIFILPSPEIYSLPLMIIAVILIITSSFLLARRQAQIEKIK